MKALHITAHGPAGTLKPLEVPRPPLGAEQVRVRIEADQLRLLFESGRLRPHPVLESHPLEDAARAYEQVARGSPSKVVLVPRSGV
jgi:hypothetical protein